MKEVENKATISETALNGLGLPTQKNEKTLDIADHYLLAGKDNLTLRLRENSILCLITNECPANHTITVGAQCMQVNSNQNMMLLIEKNELLEIRSDAQNSLLISIFLEYTFNSSIYQYLLNHKPCLDGAIPGTLQFNCPRLRLWQSKILEIQNSKTETGQIKLKALLFEIVATQCDYILNQGGFSINSPGQNLTAIHLQKALEAKKILDSALTENYTIRQLALLVGTNEQYLKQHFKLLFAHTISSYKTSIKMEYAKQLIQRGDYQVWEVAAKVGFNHATHFTSTFKKYFGLKPKDLKSS